MSRPEWPEWLQIAVEDMRLFLRKSSTRYDDEIAMQIMAALEDMEGAGVGGAASRFCFPEAGIREAVKLYLKANFGFPEDSEKWQMRYEKLRDSMASRRGTAYILSKVMPEKGPPYGHK